MNELERRAVKKYGPKTYEEISKETPRGYKTKTKVWVEKVNPLTIKVAEDKSEQEQSLKQ